MARETKIAKKIKITTTVFVAIVLFALLQCIAPVSATWTYASYVPAAPVAQPLPLSLSPFAYEYGPDTAEARTLQEIGNKIVAALSDPSSTFYSAALTEYVHSMKGEGYDERTGEDGFFGHRKPDPRDEDQDNQGMFISSYDLAYADRPDGSSAFDPNGSWNNELLATVNKAMGKGIFVLTGDFEDFARNPTKKLYLFTTVQEATRPGVAHGMRANTTAPPEEPGQPTMVVPVGGVMHRVFRATIEKVNWWWEITAVERGYAPAGIVSSGFSFEINGPTHLAPIWYLGYFDHKRWAPGKWGTSKDQAIWINRYQDCGIVLADNATEKVYYMCTLKAGESFKISVSRNDGYHLEYMKPGDTGWAPAPLVGGSYVASCTAPGTYYFRFWGAETMEYYISDSKP